MEDTDSECEDDLFLQVDRVLQRVRQCEQPQHRGRVSTKIARLGRKAKLAARRKAQVNDRIAGLIKRYNEHFAKTAEEVIDLDQQKLPAAKGRGAYKQWLPSALLRVCWGSKPRRRVLRRGVPRFKRLRQKTSGVKAPKVAAPTVSSTRSWAREMNSSTTHIARVRHGMSELFMRIQEDALKELPWASQQWVHIALDETQEPVMLHAPNEMCQVLVIHMKLDRLPASGDQIQRINVVLPTVLLRSTTTVDLYSGLQARLPLDLSRFAALAQETVFFLNTDSFSSCMRLHKILARQVTCLCCPCRMHQLCMSLTSGLVYSNLMSPLFCGSLTLRQSRFQQLLRTRLKHVLSNQLVLVYERPEPSAVSHANAVWDLFWPLLVSGPDEAAGHRPLMGKKAQAWRRLKRNLQGPLRSAAVVHFCPFGCHSSREAVLQELYQDFCTLFFDAPPPVPAFNKWTKVAPVLQWFSPLFAVHQLLPQLLEPVLASIQEAASSRLAKSFLPDAEGEGASLGLGDESGDFFKQEYLRVRRFHSFVTAPNAGQKVIAVLLSMLPSLNVLGSFFRSAMEPVHMLQSSKKPCTALDLGRPSCSPANKAVKVLLEALSDERSSFWQAFLPQDAAWTENLYCVAATALCLQVGQLQSRLVLPFAAWPWKAALFFESDDDVSLATKQALARELFRLCDHQDPFVLEFKKNLHCVADVLSASNLEKIHHLLLTAPITNFISEKSFAGSHTRRGCNHGMSPKLVSLAAEHVLAESKTIVDTFQRDVMNQPHQQPRAAPASRMGRSAWHDFVSQHMTSNVTLAQIGDMWKALPQASRRRASRSIVNDAAEQSPVLAGQGLMSAAPETTWPHTGDSFYPVRAECLQELPQAIRSLADSWAARVGNGFCKSVDVPAIPEAQLCGVICRLSLSADDKNSAEIWRKKLNRWAALFKAKPNPLTDPGWKPLPLYHITPATTGVVFPHDGQGLLFLQLCSLHDQQIYCRSTTRTAPCVGEQLQLQMTVESLVSAAQVVEECKNLQRQVGNLQTLLVQYQHLALTSFKVLGLEDLAAKETEAASKQKAGKDAAFVKSAASALDDRSLWRPTKRVRSKSTHPGLRPGPSSSAPADASDRAGLVEPVDILQQWDAELDSQANAADLGSKEQQLACELLDDFGATCSDVEDVLDMSAEGAEVDTPAAEQAAESAPSSSSARATGRTDAPGHDSCDLGGVRMDASGKVYDAAGVFLGSLTSLKVGTADEAFSVYCARHGCQFLRKVARAPSKRKLLGWFFQGTLMPAGKDAALQYRHKQSFPGPED